MGGKWKEMKSSYLKFKCHNLFQSVKFTDHSTERTLQKTQSLQKGSYFGKELLVQLPSFRPVRTKEKRYGRYN